MNFLVYGLIAFGLFVGLVVFSSILSSNRTSSELSLAEEFLVDGQNTCQSSVSYLQSGGLEPPVSVQSSQSPPFDPELVRKDSGSSFYTSVVRYGELTVYLSEPDRIFPTTPIFLYLYDFHQSPTSLETKAVVQEMVGRGFIVVVPEVVSDPYLVDSTNYYLSLSASSYQQFIVRDLLFLLQYLEGEYPGSSLMVYGNGWGAILGSILVSNSSYPSVLLVSLPIVDPNRYFLEGGPVSFHPDAPFSRVYFGERAVSFKCSAGYLSYFTYLEGRPLFLLEWRSGRELGSLSRVLEEEGCVRTVSDLRRGVERWAEGIDC